MRPRPLTGAAASLLLVTTLSAHAAEPSLAQRERMTALITRSDADWDARALREGNRARVTCGPTLVEETQRLAETLARRAETRPFALRFYLASAMRARAWGCLGEASYWVRHGLQAAPDDPELLLMGGSLDETTGSLVPAIPPAVAMVGLPRERARMRAAERDRTASLESARLALEKALRKVPALHEARLRLGRVEWRLGRARPARAALEAVLSSTKDARQLYLAYLFLGRIEEDEGRIAAAQRSYQAAVALRPSAQSAAVALSHARLAGGDAPGARNALEDALDAAGDPDRMDELWAYALGRVDDADRMFDAMREEAAR